MMTFYHSMIEEINRFGVSGIAALQSGLPGYDDVFHAITEVGNAAHTFTFLFPLAAAVDLQLACDLLVVSFIGELLNTLLKWTLMEGRPYWWVRETDIYKRYGLTAPVLQQTTHTCETGAGSPSGHVMHIAAIGFVLVSWIIAKYDSRSKFPRPGAARFRKLLWGSYALVLMLVGLSRMYIAAHFPHQCALGAIIGIPLAWVVTSKSSPVSQWWKQAGRIKLLCASTSFSVLAFGGYWVQRGLGIDPQWSVRLAFKWCQSPHNLHVSTTNIFSLVRDCGSAFGFAVACPYSWRLANQRLSIPLGFLGALLLNVAVRLIQKTLPTANVFAFYLAHFFIHTALPLLFLGILHSTRFDTRRADATATSNQLKASRQSRAKYD